MKGLEQTASEGRRRRLSRDNKWHKVSASDDQTANNHEAHDVHRNEGSEDLLSEDDNFCRVNHEFEFIEDEIQIESYDEISETIEIEDDFDTDFDKDSVIAWI